MNFQQLRTVREAIRKKYNLTDAAEVLCTSQSGVSRQLRELEEELGITIFERHGKRLNGLTGPGAEIVRIIENILTEKEKLNNAAREYYEINSGKLTIACTQVQSMFRLPKVITAFRETYPLVRLALHQTSPAQIVEMIRRGDAEMGFVDGSLSKQNDFAIFPAYRWLHRIIVPVGHPLSHIPQIGLHNLREYPIITYEEGVTGRSNIDEAFSAVNIVPNIVLTATDSEVIKTYVKLGLGVGIVAELAYNADVDNDITCLPDILFPSNKVHLAVRRGSYLRTYTVSFIKMLVPGLSDNEVRQVVQGGEL